jgi:hypothetical protein
MTDKVSMGKEYQKKEQLMQMTLSHLRSIAAELETAQDMMLAAREFLFSQEANDSDKEMVMMTLRAIPLEVLKSQ